MKKTKKILSLVLAAALLVTATVATTVAWLTSTDEVVNTFTVGNVTITLDEADVNIEKTVDGETVYEYTEYVKGNSKVDNIEDADRVKTNEYHIIPGSTYSKDPTVKVASGSEDCYVFVKVQNGLANVLDANGLDIDADKWTTVGENIYLYKEVLSEGDKAVVFTEFTVAEDVTDSAYSAAANATIVVNAYAIQAEGFDAEDADDLDTMMKALGLK